MTSHILAERIPIRPVRDIDPAKSAPKTLLSAIEHNLTHLGNKVAFHFLTNGDVDGPKTTLTFAGMERRVRALTNALLREGLAGKRALLLYEPGLEFIAAFLACLYAGVIAVPAYPPDVSRLERSISRLRSIARDCEPAAVLTSSFIASAAEAMKPLAPELNQAQWMATDCIEQVDEIQPFRDFAPDDVAFLQYTSGSTAEPRGVKVTHGNLRHNSDAIRRVGQGGPNTVAVVWLPCYHDMGLIAGIIQPLYTGFTSVLMSPMAFLKDPARWLRAISHFRGTDSAFPNFALDLCVRKVREDELARLDLRSWKNAWNGAEPIRHESMRRFADRFRVCGFREEAFLPVYGLAESTLIASGNEERRRTVIRTVSRNELAQHRVQAVSEGSPGSVALVGCGKAIAEQEIAIVDPEHRLRAKPGAVGEIWLRGPSVAAGYWGSAEATTAVFGARLADTSGGPFLRTGDLGFVEHGELFITGRRKDVIIIRGANHYPQDIEAAAEQAHQAMRPGSVAAVISMGEDGEELAILAEIRDDRGDGIAAEQNREIARCIREAVAAETGLVAAKIALLPMGALPKTSSGKIQRHACREGLATNNLVTRYVDIIPRTPATPRENRLAEQIDIVHQGALEALVRVTGHPRETFHMDTRLVGYVGLDSLQTASLVAELEKRFGALGDGLLADAQMTFGDLLGVLRKRAALPTKQADAVQGNIAPPAPKAITHEAQIQDFPEVSEIRAMMMLFQALGIENPYWNSIAGPARDVVQIGDTSMINFATYNYLGLVGDPRVNAAAVRAIEQYGTSGSASRVASGDRRVHRELENAIASFLGCEDALVFASGHATNVTAISTLVGRGDLIVHDSLAHESLLAGARLSGAQRVAFPHNDLEALNRLLCELRPSARRALIVVEGVYSMDGDLAPLRELVAIKKQHDALLYVDEAHSMGCVGATGRGIGEHAGIDRSDVDVWMGTLSKALASCGGYVAGSRALIDMLKYRGGGFVYAAAISPANAAAAREALRILEAEPSRVAALQNRAARFAELCRQRGIDIGASNATAIIPVIVGASVRCLQVADTLRKKGIHAPPIFYPAVEEGRARLRFFMSALHSDEQLVQAADAIALALREHPEIAPIEAPRGSTILETNIESTPQPIAMVAPEKQRRIFVTGASGFIGSRVVRRLVEAGHDVRCLLRPTSKTHRLDGLQYEARIGDLSDPLALEDAMRGCDVVIHLACASSWAELSALGDGIFAIAVEGTRNVLQAAQRAGVMRFVHVSSVAAVNASEKPHLFDETSPYQIEKLGLTYSLAKRKAEELVLQYAQDGFDAVIVSPAEVYGPGDDAFVTAGNIVHILQAPAPITCQGGTSITHVDDVAGGIVEAVHKGHRGERYILGGENLTIRDLTRMVLRLAGKRDAVINIPNAALSRLTHLMHEAGMTSPVPEDALEYATLYWFVDSGKACRDLDYRPRNAESTLRSVVDWLKERGLSS